MKLQSTWLKHGIIVAKNVKNLYSTLSSALLFVIAFLKPVLFYFSIFLFMIPLLYALKNNIRLSFYNGLLWGMIVYSSIFFDIYQIIIIQGQGTGRYGAVLFLLCYGAFYSGVWFYSCTRVTYNIKNNYYKYLLWTVCTLLYFWF